MVASSNCSEDVLLGAWLDSVLSSLEKLFDTAGVAVTPTEGLALAPAPRRELLLEHRARLLRLSCRLAAAARLDEPGEAGAVVVPTSPSKALSFQEASDEVQRLHSTHSLRRHHSSRPHRHQPQQHQGMQWLSITTDKPSMVVTEFLEADSDSESGGPEHRDAEDEELHSKKQVPSPSSMMQRQATRFLESNVLHDKVSPPHRLYEMCSALHDTVTSREWVLTAVRGGSSVARLYTLVVTPLVACFSFAPPPTASTFEVLCELMLLASISVPFLRGLWDAEASQWVTSRGAVLMAYARGWLWLDVLSAIPWHTMWLVGGSRDPLLLRLSLMRLLQLPRLVSEFFTEGETHIFSSSVFASLHPNLLRALKLFCLFFLMVHLVACGYYFVASSHGGSTWAAYAAEQPSLMEEWTHAYYWALCGVLGENMAPAGFAEAAYNSMVIAVGVLLNSCIVGSITSLLGSLDERAARQKSKLDSVNAFMQRNGVTSDLCEQVRQYYKYLYASVQVQSADGMFDDLSSSLRLKIDLCIHKKFIQKCHIFAQCPPDCVVTLVTVISRNPRILVPTELVFSKGDVGDAMYFIAKGEIVLYDPGNAADDSSLDISELLSLQGGKTACGARMLARSHAGDFFGELALLASDSIRAASAAAETFAELLCLPRYDFEGVLRQHPRFAAQLRDYIARRYSQERAARASKRLDKAAPPGTVPDVGYV